MREVAGETDSTVDFDVLASEADTESETPSGTDTGLPLLCQPL